ncbi:antitoxin HicB [Sutterella megalosphaeroides]|uniref:Antitoxin HicB n=2 Tax=Sutterella megalosphaeroides TaxID=2494234 RepID=A0A2Z6IBE0_9BURK|nr:antitoxin HicB [Sutterella megalosphaeroides]
MFYGLKTEVVDGKVMCTCRDIPECVYDAPTVEEGEKFAAQAFPAALELFYRRKRAIIPLPSPLQEGEIPIRVPTRVQGKILLWNYMIENRYRLSDLSRLLNISATQVQRFVDLSKDGASMEAIDDALDVLGAHFTLTLQKR